MNYNFEICHIVFSFFQTKPRCHCIINQSYIVWFKKNIICKNFYSSDLFTLWFCVKLLWHQIWLCEIRNCNTSIWHSQRLTRKFLFFHQKVFLQCSLGLELAQPWFFQWEFEKTQICGLVLKYSCCADYHYFAAVFQIHYILNVNGIHHLTLLQWDVTIFIGKFIVIDKTHFAYFLVQVSCRIA